MLLEGLTAKTKKQMRVDGKCHKQMCLHLLTAVLSAVGSAVST